MNMYIKGLWVVGLFLFGLIIVQVVMLLGLVVSVQWLLQYQYEVNIVDVCSDLVFFFKVLVFIIEKGIKMFVMLGGYIFGVLLFDFGKMCVVCIIDGCEIKVMLFDQQVFQVFMCGIGVKVGKLMVIVFEGVFGVDLDMVVCVYWLMKVYGDDYLVLFEGGIIGWLQQGLVFDIVFVVVGEGDWVVIVLCMKYIVSSQDVVKVIGSGVQIVDVCLMLFYVGLIKKLDVGSVGYIKGVVNLLLELCIVFIGGVEYYFLLVQYQVIFKYLDIKVSKFSIIYCNIGYFVLGVWFVLSEVMKNLNICLYDGLMLEWMVEQCLVVGLF